MLMQNTKSDRTVRVKAEGLGYGGVWQKRASRNNAMG